MSSQLPEPGCDTLAIGDSHRRMDQRLFFGHSLQIRRETQAVGIRVIEQLVTRPPLTMRKLIDETKYYRWFGSAFDAAPELKA